MISSALSYIRQINKHCSTYCSRLGFGQPVSMCENDKCPLHSVRMDKAELALYGEEQRTEWLKEAVAFIQISYLAIGQFEWASFRKAFNKAPWSPKWWGSPLTGKLQALGWMRTSTVSKSKTGARKGGTSFVWEHINRTVSEAA